MGNLTQEIRCAPSKLRVGCHVRLSNGMALTREKGNAFLLVKNPWETSGEAIFFYRISRHEWVGHRFRTRTEYVFYDRSPPGNTLTLGVGVCFKRFRDVLAHVEQVMRAREAARRLTGSF